MKLRTRLTLLFSLLALIPLLLVSYIGYLNQRNSLLVGRIEQMVSIADIQKKRINEKLDRYIEQVSLVTSRTQLRRSMLSYAETNSAEDLDNVSAIIRDAASSIQDIVDISIISLNGDVVASTESDRVGNDVSKKDFFSNGKRVHELHEVFKDDENRLRAQLIGPLIFEGQLVGVAEVIVRADSLVSVTEDYAGLGLTGEVILARRNDAGDALFITPLRFDSGGALARAVPKKNKAVPITRALLGEERAFIEDGLVDYRGREVFSVTRYIDALDWGLVIKVDKEEALESVTELTKSYVSLIFLSLTLIVTISLLVTRTITEPIDELAMFAKKLQKGSFGGIVDVSTEDEIGLLAKSFNSMSRRLGSLYGDLEKEVENRTRELERALKQVEAQNKEVLDQREETLNVLDDLSVEKDKLQESKAKDEAILQSLGDGLVVTDKEGNISLVNTAFEQLTGFSKQDVLGRSFVDLVRSQEDDGSLVPSDKRSLTMLLARGELFSRERSHTHYYVRKDGTRFPVSSVVTPIRLRNNVLGAVEVFRDVTREKEIDKAKTEFVSLASHQLRTPLSTINWYAEMLQAGDAGELTLEQKKYIDEIYKGNQRMVDLVNALLDVSRIDMGTFSVEPTPTNIVEVAKSVVKELEPDIFKKKLLVNEKYAKGIPIINVDSKLIRILFQNLLSNSVKYTPEEGTVNLTVTFDEESLYIEVADTGMGIPQEQQKKIFTKLFRADNVKESDTTGTGLGLYLLKAIVDHSGGSVRFDSVVGKGTTFYVDLPLAGMKERKGTRELGE